MITVRVPATTANMGPGFDSIGMALQMYNTVHAEQIEKGLQIIIKNPQSIEIPTDESNLIYQTIQNFYQEIGKSCPGLRLIQYDHIPLTRGLGSSAACIVSGLHIANMLSKSRLSKEELVQMAAQIEGHPDNTTPAILGGMTIGAMDQNDMKYVKISVAENIHFAVMIPSFILPTKKAREVLPTHLSLQDSVFNASRAALLAASMMTGDFDNLPMAMQDRFHEPYREKLIPGMREIKEHAKKLGAKGIFLSGAGPTLIAVIKNVVPFRKQMLEFFKTLPNRWEIHMIQAEQQGARCWVEE